MFDFSWGEVLMIGAVALIVIGPKDLPAALRTVGRTIGKVKRMAAEFQGQFNEALREADLDKVRKDVEGMSKAASTGFNPVKSIRDEVKGAIDKPGGVAKAAAVATAASGASARNAAAFLDARGDAVKADAAAEATPEPAASELVAKAASKAEPKAAVEPASTPEKKPLKKSQVTPATKAADTKAADTKAAGKVLTKPVKKSGSDAPAKKSAAASRKKEEKDT